MKLSLQIGARIKSIRLRLNYSQELFGHNIGVSDGAVSSWEMGDSLPSVKNCISIAKIGEVSIDWLLTGAAMDKDSAYEQDLTEDEIKLLIAYRRAAKARKMIVLEILTQGSDRISHKTKKD